jgi:MtN3 and saliva related transmembrane protein
VLLSEVVALTASDEPVSFAQRRCHEKRGRMNSLATLIGLSAGICTTLANLPQLIKAWSTRETDDISLKTLLLLGFGLILWVLYGVLHEDIIIILANGVSLMILAGLLYAKMIQS